MSDDVPTATPATPEGPFTPAELLGEAAGALAGVTRVEAEGATTWQAGETPFAILRGASAEFRLRTDMVRAGLRTPNTRPSERGPEWIVFDTPPDLDTYDRDRLRSWFEMAVRLAGG